MEVSSSALCVLCVRPVKKVVSFLPRCYGEKEESNREKNSKKSLTVHPSPGRAKSYLSFAQKMSPGDLKINFIQIFRDGGF